MCHDNTHAPLLSALLAITRRALQEVRVDVLGPVEAQDVNPAAVEALLGADLLKVGQVRTALDKEAAEVETRQGLEELLGDDLLDERLEGSDRADGHEHGPGRLAMLGLRRGDGGVGHDALVVAALGLRVEPRAELRLGLGDGVGEE